MTKIRLIINTIHNYLQNLSLNGFLLKRFDSRIVFLLKFLFIMDIILFCCFSFFYYIYNHDFFGYLAFYDTYYFYHPYIFSWKNISMLGLLSWLPSFYFIISSKVLWVLFIKFIILIKIMMGRPLLGGFKSRLLGLVIGVDLEFLYSMLPLAPCFRFLPIEEARELGNLRQATIANGGVSLDESSSIVTVCDKNLVASLRKLGSSVVENKDLSASIEGDSGYMQKYVVEPVLRDKLKLHIMYESGGIDCIHAQIDKEKLIAEIKKISI